MLNVRCVFLLTALVSSDGMACGEEPQAVQAGARGKNAAVRDSLSKLAPALRVEKKLVGLGAMITVDGQAAAAVVNGERKKGGGAKLATGDRWHLGSITKSLTATVIARLVERGELQWSTTVGDRFDELFEVHTEYRDVTLEQLLTHRSSRSLPRSGASTARSITDRFERSVLEHIRSRIGGDRSVALNLNPSFAIDVITTSSEFASQFL